MTWKVKEKKVCDLESEGEKGLWCRSGVLLTRGSRGGGGAGRTLT